MCQWTSSNADNDNKDDDDIHICFNNIIDDYGNNDNKNDDIINRHNNIHKSHNITQESRPQITHRSCGALEDPQLLPLQWLKQVPHEVLLDVVGREREGEVRRGTQPLHFGVIGSVAFG